MDINGVLFGTTYSGGNNNGGTVFTLNETGSSYGVSHNFNCNGDGCHPVANLILNENGLLYGTTGNGGAKTGGIVFSLNQGGSSYRYRTISAP